MKRVFRRCYVSTTFEGLAEVHREGQESPSQGQRMTGLIAGKKLGRFLMLLGPKARSISRHKAGYLHFIIPIGIR